MGVQPIHLETLGDLSVSGRDVWTAALLIAKRYGEDAMLAAAGAH
jgi:hypothetical protein